MARTFIYDRLSKRLVNLPGDKIKTNQPSIADIENDEVARISELSQLASNRTAATSSNCDNDSINISAYNLTKSKILNRDQKIGRLERTNTIANTSTITNTNAKAANKFLSEEEQNNITLRKSKRKHIYKRRNIILKCDVCKQIFPNEKSLYYHRNHYKNTGKHKCKICHLCFNNHKYFATHQRQAHSQNVSGGLKLRCKFCNQCFKYERSIHAHTAHYHGTIYNNLKKMKISTSEKRNYLTKNTKIKKNIGFTGHDTVSTVIPSNTKPSCPATSRQTKLTEYLISSSMANECSSAKQSSNNKLSLMHSVKSIDNNVTDYNNTDYNNAEIKQEPDIEMDSTVSNFKFSVNDKSYGSEKLVNEEYNLHHNCKSCFVKLVRIDDVHIKSEISNDSMIEKFPSHTMLNDSLNKNDVFIKGAFETQLKELKVTLTRLEEMDCNKKELSIKSSTVNDIPDLKCIYCNSTFTSNDKLSYHIKAYHIMYMSSICRTRFRFRSKLIVHYLNYHTRARSNECCVCLEVLPTANSLYHHLKLHCVEVNLIKEDDVEMRHEVVCNQIRMWHKCPCGKKYLTLLSFKWHQTVCKYRTNVNDVKRIDPPEKENPVDYNEVAANSDSTIKGNALDTINVSIMNVNETAVTELNQQMLTNYKIDINQEELDYVEKKERMQRKQSPCNDIHTPCINSKRTNKDVKNVNSTKFSFMEEKKTGQCTQKIAETPNEQTLNMEDIQSPVVVLNDNNHMTPEENNTEQLKKIIHSTKCNENSKYQVYPCKICLTQFQNFKNFERHEKMFKGAFNEMCKTCGTKFQTKSLLRSHFLATHNVQNIRKYLYHCSICNQGFLRKVFVRQHLAHIHNKIPVFENVRQNTFVNAKKKKRADCTCEVCQVAFENLNELTNHLKYFDDKIECYCQSCNIRINGQYKLEQHNKIIHQTESSKTYFIHDCNICGERFENKHVLNSHKLHVHSWVVEDVRLSCTSNTNSQIIESANNLITTEFSPYYECNICKMTFLNLAELTSHENEFANDGNFQCNMCYKRCRTACLLESHQRVTHMNITNGAEFKCRICGEVFLNEITLNSHNEHFHNRPPMYQNIALQRCDCNSSQNPANIRRCHNQTVLVDLPDSASEPVSASQSFQFNQTASNSQLHSISEPIAVNQPTPTNQSVSLVNSKLVPDVQETVQNSFKCTVCGLTFDNKIHMKEHNMEYSNVGNYKCSLCGRKFLLPDHLQNHRIKHILDKNQYPLQCHMCKEGYYTTASLLMHMIHIHEYGALKHTLSNVVRKNYDERHSLELHRTVRVTLDDKTIQEVKISTNENTNLSALLDMENCTTNAFTDFGAEFPHVNHQHYEFQCNICKLVFKDQTCLNKHIFKYMEQGSYPCKFCNKKFHLVAFMEDHRRKHYTITLNKMFTCHLCFERYYTNISLHAHKAHFHNQCNILREILSSHRNDIDNSHKDNKITAGDHSTMQFTSSNHLSERTMSQVNEKNKNQSETIKNIPSPNTEGEEVLVIHESNLTVDTEHDTNDVINIPVSSNHDQESQKHLSWESPCLATNFVCQFCDEYYETEQGLVKHISLLHAEEITSEQPHEENIMTSKFFLCTCQKIFATHEALQEHEKQCGCLKCVYCEQVFKTDILLKRHVEYVHRSANSIKAITKASTGTTEPKLSIKKRLTTTTMNTGQIGKLKVKPFAKILENLAQVSSSAAINDTKHQNNTNNKTALQTTYNSSFGNINWNQVQTAINTNFSSPFAKQLNNNSRIVIGVHEGSVSSDALNCQELTTQRETDIDEGSGTLTAQTFKPSINGKRILITWESISKHSISKLLNNTT